MCVKYIMHHTAHLSCKSLHEIQVIWVINKLNQWKDRRDFLGRGGHMPKLIFKII